ncbi:MAG: hypothetical protein ACYYKD_05130 [Rhodospirillales bacterium]
MVNYSKYKQTADGIIITAIQVMTEMAEDYASSDKWTWGNCTPWQVPEFLCTAAIAGKLAEPGKRGVYPEYHIPWMVKEAKTGSGRPKKLGKQTRCDILIADGKTDIPRLCLEVKTSFGGETYKDVERCRKIISGKSKSKLRDAAVFFISAAVNEDTMRDGYEDWRDNWLEDNERMVVLNDKNHVVKSFDSINTHKFGKYHWYVGAIQMSLPDK